MRISILTLLFTSVAVLAGQSGNDSLLQEQLDQLFPDAKTFSPMGENVFASGKS